MSIIEKRRNKTIIIHNEVNTIIEKYGSWMSTLNAELYWSYMDLIKVKNRLQRQINYYNKTLKRKGGKLADIQRYIEK